MRYVGAMPIPLLLALSLSLCPGAAAAAAAPAWFFPGRGPEIAVLGEDGRLRPGDARGRALPGAPGPQARRTGALIVRATDDAALAALAALPQVASSRLLAGSRRQLLLQVADGVDEISLSRQLRQRPDVLWAHPDLALSPAPTALPDDPYLSGQWHLENSGQGGWTAGVDIDAEAAWAVTTGAGLLVAVIDGGVQVDHPDLDVVDGWDFVDGDADPSPDPADDDAAHGTCAAGIAAAVGDNGVGVAGVAYDAQVYGVRLLGGDTTTSDLHDALVDAVDAGAAVLSNSWGFDNGCSAYMLWATVAEALDHAEEEGRGGLGAVVVFSAGNGACDNGGDGLLAHEAVIGVAASDGDDDREWYSSYGDGVDLTGPSGAILTTDLTGDQGYGSYEGDGDYVGSFSGTSASAPVVSGVAALMLAANPRLTAAQVRQVLCETAEPIDVDSEDGAYDDQGWSPWYGCGRVNAAAAVLAVADQPPPAPTLTFPVASATEDRVLLQWAAEDPDGDRLSYELTWARTGEEASTVTLDEASLDLTGQVAAGDVVGWSVRAVDRWGPGEAATGTFEVLPVAQQPTAELPVGCAAAPAGGLALPLLPLLLRRRRRP